MYVFKKKDGFSFSSDVEKHVTVSGGEFWKADQMGGKKGLLRVFVNFPSSSNPNRVKEVSMTMNSKGDFKTIEDLKCQSFVPADKLELVNQMFFAGLKDTANEHTIQDLTTAYQPAADYTGVYVFKLKSGFSFAQDITDLAKKHVTISEGEIYSMDTMTDTDGAMLLRVFVSFEGTDSSIEKVTLNTPTRSEINQAASSVGFMPTSYTPSEKMSYGLKVMVGLNQDETGPSLEDGKFDAKQDYSVLYNLQPKDGFDFAEGFSAKDVTVSNGTVYKVEMSGKDCYVYVNFPAKAAEDPNYVTEAAVQVAAVAGEIPSINGITVTSSNADKIKTALVLWSNTSTPFVAGQEYSTTVYLEPKEGVTFADNMKLNVNGKVVDLAKKDPNGSVQFLVKITATGSTHTHSYGTDWKYDDTNHWHECECGDKADIAAHSASEWIIDTAATETADGAKHKECTVCKKVLETATIPATHSHSYNQETVKPEALKTPADCTSNAVYFKSCSCGAISTTDTFVAMNTALGHAYGSDWKYDSTNHWHECSRCHDKKDEAAHDYGSDNVCDTCGYYKTVPHTHNLTLVAAKAATCTEGGKEAYYKCEGCGKFYEDVLGTKEITDLASWGNIAKIAHTTKQTVTKATPTANGKIVNYCSVCKKTLSTTVIPKASSIKLKATSLTYNGKVRTPKVIVKDRTGKTLVKNTDYTVSYAKGRKYVGKYAVKITFKGKYSGTKTLYFTIKPKATSISSLKAGSKKFTVKWKKQATQTTGYQVQYSASSKFSKAKTVTVGKNTTVSKKISKLSGKKKYYVRVRTYKTVKINGKSIRIYSGWSKAKTVTTKK